MIFSKANLTVEQIAHPDPFFKGLNGVRFEGDGSTAASNGRMLMAVGPADPDKSLIQGMPIDAMEPGQRGVLMTLEAVQTAIKHLPRDKREQLQYIAMTRVKDAERIGLTSVDAKGNTNTHASLPRSGAFPDWRGLIRKILGKREYRICLNRKDLIDLLKAMESAAPNRADVNPVFIEFGGDGAGAVLRCQSHETGQHIVGVLNVYDTKGHWMKQDEWETSILADDERKEKPALVRRIMKRK